MVMVMRNDLVSPCLWSFFFSPLVHFVQTTIATSNLELTDLPHEVRDLNFAIVYNERGSFSLSKNRLKLFLSFNQFTTIPMHVFELHNLSVLSLSKFLTSRTAVGFSVLYFSI
jgi:hypothetical protein